MKFRAIESSQLEHIRQVNPFTYTHTHTVSMSCLSIQMERMVLVCFGDVATKTNIHKLYTSFSLLLLFALFAIDFRFKIIRENWK